MAKKNFKTIDKLIEDPRRVIAIVIIIVVVVLLLYFFWGKIQTLFAKLSGKIQANQELNEYTEQTGQTPSLSDVKIRSLANQIEEAAYDDNLFFGLGTNEEKIYDAFNQLGNTADLLKLKSIYGTRHDKMLDATISSELNRGEIRTLNNILANKNIDYSFK